MLEKSFSVNFANSHGQRQNIKNKSSGVSDGTKLSKNLNKKSQDKSACSAKENADPNRNPVIVMVAKRKTGLFRTKSDGAILPSQLDVARFEQRFQMDKIQEEDSQVGVNLAKRSRPSFSQSDPSNDRHFVAGQIQFLNSSANSGLAKLKLNVPVVIQQNGTGKPLQLRVRKLPLEAGFADGPSVHSISGHPNGFYVPVGQFNRNDSVNMQMTDSRNYFLISEKSIPTSFGLASQFPASNVTTFSTGFASQSPVFCFPDNVNSGKLAVGISSLRHIRASNGIQNSEPMRTILSRMGRTTSSLFGCLTLWTFDHHLRIFPIITETYQQDCPIFKISSCTLRNLPHMGAVLRWKIPSISRLLQTRLFFSRILQSSDSSPRMQLVTRLGIRDFILETYSQTKMYLYETGRSYSIVAGCWK